MSEKYTKYLEMITDYSKRTATETDFVGIQCLIANIIIDHARDHVITYREYRNLIDAAYMVKDSIKAALRA